MYEKTIQAALVIERSTWGMSFALADEVPKNDNGNVVRGEWPKVVKALKDAGVTSTSGDPYSEKWLATLHEVAVWTRETPLGEGFAKYPFKRVQAAKNKARGDHEKALAILAENTTMHEIAGTRIANVEPTVEQALQVISKADPDDLGLTVMRMEPKEQRKVQKAASKIEVTAAATHPANQKKEPLGIQEPKVDFYMNMAGPLTRLHDGVVAVESTWQRHIEDAHPDSVEIVRERIADEIAKLEVLTTEWSTT